MDSNFGFLTVKEVADLLRLNILTIYDYIKQGRVNAVRFGRNYRISTRSLEQFIEENSSKHEFKGVNRK